MRQASYLVKGDKGVTADVSLVVLDGAAGGTLGNVNRWLGQLGQPGITEEKLTQIAQNITCPLGDVTIVDLEGLPPGGDAAKDGRILGGMASSGGKTYFFKMHGNAALVQSQKDAFVKWVGSVHPSGAGESQAATSVAAAAPPADMGAASAGMAAPPADTGKPQIKWEVPDDWKPSTTSSMRYASFTVAGGTGAPADMSVVVLGGDAGGDLANVNRWRGQVGLDPVADSDLQSLITHVASPAGDILTVNMAGAKARVLAGWIHNQGQTWFFKLTGPDALVAGEKEKFAKFLQSVQFKP